MFVTISIMFIAAAFCIIAFIIAAPQGTPVLVGQRWEMPGLGNILIIDTNVKSSSPSDVKYQLTNGEYGYCTKYEVRYTGKLLPYSKNAQREIYIDKILRTVRDRNQERVDKWKPYRPPAGWVKPKKAEHIYDAEIVEPEPDASDEGDHDESLAISEDDFIHP
jgi:hypothetical protein